MVTTTSAAEESARKNDLTFVDLLLPHAVVNTSNITFQSQSDSGKGSYKLPEFRVHFCNASDIAQPPEQFVDAQCARVIDQYSKEAEESIAAITCRADVQDFLLDRDGLPRDVVPWFTRWRKEFSRGLRCSNFEYFDHPIACIIVASSDEEDAIAKFRSLFDMAKLPPLFREGAVDPNIFLHYVLIHDEQSSDLKRTEETLRQMRGIFGPSATTMLRINSLPVAQPNLQQHDIWAQYREFGESARGPRGRFLSVQDIASIQKYVADFVGVQLIPHIDRKIKTLNSVVNANKRGFKNQWKSWWKPKGAEMREGVVDSGDGSGPTYLYNSMEAQIRQLADLAFMMQDYELALSNYRLVQSDFKKDKGWFQFAAANEMTALALYMLDGSKRDTEASLDMAYSNYQRCGMSRHTVRVTLLQMDMHKSRMKMKEATETLLRCASSETDDLRAALLMEQAALCFLQMTPSPHFRKFALHLVLAGHRFYKCNQRSHALQCYMSALNTYRARCWTYIDDHIHSTLAKHSVALKRFDDAIDFSLKLLNTTGNKSSEKQAAYLNDFVNIIRKNFSDKKRWVHDFPSPVISDGSVRVITNDRTHPTVSDDLGGEELWDELEEILVDEAQYREKRKHERGNQLQNFRRIFDDSIDRNDHKGVVGETIEVTFDVRNKLQVDLELSEMGLICQMIDAQDQKLMFVGRLEDASETDLPVVIEHKTLSLAPQQTANVSLRVTPKCSGSLTIIGVAWKLDGTVCCRHDFHIRGVRLNSSLDERVSVMYSVDSRLCLKIVDPMPLIAVTVRQFPTALHVGEVVMCEMQLKNLGTTAAANIKLNTNKPSSVVVSSSQFPDWPATLPPCDSQSRVLSSSLDKRDCDGVYSVTLPLTALSPNESFVVPLWVNAETTGIHNFKFVLYYEPLSSASGGLGESAKSVSPASMLYRLVHHSERMIVHPSLSPFVHIRPSRKDIDQFILSLTIENQRQDVFELQQLTCLSPSWALAPLSATTGVEGCGDKYEIRPRSRVTVFFKLTPASPESESDAAPRSHLSHVPFALKRGSVDMFKSPHMMLYAQKDQLCCLPFRKLNALAPVDAPTNSQSTGSFPLADFILLFGSAANPFSCCIRFDTKSNMLSHSPQSRTRRSSSVSTPPQALQSSQSAHGHRRKSFVGREMSLSPLKFKINCPPDLHADFSNSGLCVISGTIQVWNSDADQPVSFVFETTNSDDNSEPLPNAPTPPAAMTDYEWSGHILKKVDELPPRSTITLPFDLIIPRPGVYNLNRFFLNVSTPGMTSVDAALSDMQHLVIIHELRQ